MLGLSVPQFDILSTLTEGEGISQQELADKRYVTKGNVSGLIDRLVEGNLVERQPLPDDRRFYALYLTPEGRELAESGMAIQRAYVERTLGKLNQADLGDLDRIVTNWREFVRADMEALSPKSVKAG